MWDTCTSHFGPKKFDRVGRGGQGRSKYGTFGSFQWAMCNNALLCTQPIPSSWQNGLPPALATSVQRGVNSRQNSVCSGLKFSSKLFGVGPLCSRATSATLSEVKSGCKPQVRELHILYNTCKCTCCCTMHKRQGSRNSTQVQVWEGGGKGRRKGCFTGLKHLKRYQIYQARKDICGGKHNDFLTILENNLMPFYSGPRQHPGEEVQVWEGGEERGNNWSV